MNLTDLIHEVWKDERVRKLKIRKSEVRVVVKVAIEHMVKGLINNGKLMLTNLFTLDIRKISGRKIMNIKTGKHMQSKGYYKVGLEPSQKLKNELKKLK
ncbi:DNA-binding protein HU [Bacillus phage vB_BanS-Thrax5]|nr:DNA-binding protein HU [Bacillus phage vB_BanS-Thrax5]